MAVGQKQWIPFWGPSHFRTHLSGWIGGYDLKLTHGRMGSQKYTGPKSKVTERRPVPYCVDRRFNDSRVS